MARAQARTAKEYLAALPEDRRAVVTAARDLILRHLPRGYRESADRGAITYEIPLVRYPDTYNGRPLCYLGLAAQKNHYALYLMSVYMDPERARRLAREFAKRGKKLDLGKSCLRFRTLDELPLEVVGRVIAETTPDEFIAMYEAARPRPARKAVGRKAAGRKAAGRKTAGRKTAGRKTAGRKTTARNTAARKATARKAAAGKTAARRRSA